ncbi:hypothetical protein JTE90_020037 [Oedothorax gibbosus]|uniref:Kazal-like domain-containing protein n=1 Tax=Oedothorax gibbosus TaxID=931172 RepID=A0AAV6URX3_9ARAC|nr:hypothetical protein JTE90_020037 [Oedothorax gibbosus]
MNQRFTPVSTVEPELRKYQDEPAEPDDDTRCGIGPCKPSWLQRFADPKVYLIIYCIVGVIEGAHFTYFVGVLTTLEKRFAFESKISGIILIADNISGACLSLIIGYFGGKWHKPRLIAFGMVMVAVSSFLCTIPYFMYGPALHLLTRETFELGNNNKKEYCDGIVPEENCERPGSSATLNNMSDLKYSLLDYGSDVEPSHARMRHSGSEVRLHILFKPKESLEDNAGDYCLPSKSIPKCEIDDKLPESSHPAVLMLFIANFLNGFGYVAFYIIGATYLDDNVKKKNSPLYFGAMAALRIFGPTLGFLLSSFCLKYYEDPFYDPGIDPHNPRWVGAWWMGFFILGVAILFFTVLLALFPRELPARFRSEQNKSKEEEEREAMPKLKDFPQAIKRLLKNPILVCHVISVTFQINGFVGYFVFMPKFMEAQYQQSASDASLFSGATGIVSMLVGILLGGFLIKKYKPRPRFLTGYMVFVEIFSVLGLFLSIFLGCDSIQMPGTTVTPQETLNLYNECNADCGCTARVFEPVCGPDGVSTFFSPCFAGCPNMTGLTSPMVTTTATAMTMTNATVFESCKCVSSMNSTAYATSSVISGFCDSGCKMFLIYIIMLCVSKFISSTARVGNTLITFRYVRATIL